MRLVEVYLPSALTHCVAAVHARSVVAVAGVDAQASELQAVSAVHTRSEVPVAAVVSY